MECAIVPLHLKGEVVFIADNAFQGLIVRGGHDGQSRTLTGRRFRDRFSKRSWIHSVSVRRKIGTKKATLASHHVTRSAIGLTEEQVFALLRIADNCRLHVALEKTDMGNQLLNLG